MISKRDTLLRHFVCLMFLALYFFLTTPAFGQKIITGSVRDAESGESLPAANIQIEGAYEGTITNADGEFSLKIEALPAVLVVRYIGYASGRVEVTETSPNFLSIELAPTVYLLGEVEITDEDPAISIMRKVIERKQVWRASLESYEAEAYNRFTLKNDTGIVSIIESFTETYWNPTDGTREVVKARRQTNNLEFNEFMPAAQFVANLYDDNLDIAGYDFVGVTNPNAFDHYRFSLEGYRQLDDRLVYDISVQPKNKFKTAFSGRVSVLDEAFALIEVELKPGEAFLFPPPVKDFEVTYQQQFSSFGGEAWFPVDFRSTIELNVGFNLLLRFPTFYIDQVSRISNYQVNVAPPPDTLFAEGQTVVVDSVAVEEEAILDREGVAVPLARAEVEAYETIDSTMTLAKAYQPSGAFARFVDLEAEESDSSNSVRVGAGGSGGIFDRLDVEPKLWYDRVEGLYGEARIGIRASDDFRLWVSGGASTALAGDDRFTYGSGGEVDLGDKMSASLEYTRFNDTQWSSTPFLRTFNGAAVLLAGRDYYDYFQNERLRGGISADLTHRIRVGLGVQHERHRSFEKNTDYDVLASSSIQRRNPSIDEGTLRSLSMEVQVGDDDDSGGITGRKSFTFAMEHSDPEFLETDFSFTSYNAVFEWRVNTFFQRRLLPNTLDVKFVGQWSKGRPPLQRLGVIDGRMHVLNLFGAFKTADGIAVRGRRFVGFFWEHNFRTFFFEALGMDWFTQNAFNIIAFGGHAFSKENLVGLSGETAAVYSDDWRHEVGVSLSGVFSLFRIDAATRLDRPGFSVGIGMARIF